MTPVQADVVIVGGSLSAAAAAKRLVDAGYKTIVLERKKLPRHKICSGILSPRGHRFLIENFGPLPREILHEPTSCRGVKFHYPSAPSLTMDFFGGPTPHLHRKFSDHWALIRSGAEAHDLTSFVSMEQRDSCIAVEARREGRPVEYRARWVIGADGPVSPVVRHLYPGYGDKVDWFMVGQKFHEIIECPLDTDYFHFWFHPGLGYYTWSHARDGRQIVGAGFSRGGNFDVHHAGVVDWLKNKHGVTLGPGEESEASPENFGLSLLNRYVFGKGNVLVTGQAAGFLNMIGEGMSCALHSGAIAGEAIVEAARTDRPVQDVYRSMIASEVLRCSDQWNVLRMALGNPHEADFKGALKKLGLPGQLAVVRETWDYLTHWKHFGWGSQMLGQAVTRAIHDGYDSSRWL